jgi:hypothetical protein
MSEPSSPLDVRFDKADYGDGATAAQCVACRQAIHGSYYDINGKMVCERCKTMVELGQSGGSSAGRFMKACLYGGAAALLGTGIWYAVYKLLDREMGIIAIVVGLLVGGAVKKGSSGRGGWAYQALAMFLTYASIVSTYVPILLEQVIKDNREKTAAAQAAPGATSAAVTPAPPAAQDRPEAHAGPLGVLIAFAMLFALAFALPFLMGFKNIIGLFIIGIALYEAWKLNRRVPLAISGPYRVGATPPSSV